MLISKGKDDAMQACAYWPLCMLDSTEKLLEELLKFHLSASVENAGGLSERQYGLRAGRSTIGAINEVLTSGRAVQSGNRFSRKIVFWRQRNALNSLRWVDVLDALKKVHSRKKVRCSRVPDEDYAELITGS